MKPYYRILRLNHGRAPTVQHATLKDAETEALRLAGQHPGETFEILKVLGLARTTEPSIFWNDGVEPPAPTVDPGEGYRSLEPREVVELGDEFWIEHRAEWVPFSWSACGSELASKSIGRRKLPAPAADPSERYRLLAPGEKILEGDEFLVASSGRWEKCSGISIGGEADPRAGVSFRRKIAADHYPITPLPEGFDKWVCRGKGWPVPADAVWCSRWTDDSDKPPCWESAALVGPEARGWPDGGRADLEYWEAVKDEPGYRMLEFGEQVLPGDEFFRTSSKEWVPSIARDYHVMTSDIGLYRRPVQAYRMLEPGERIEEGDEFRMISLESDGKPRELQPWEPVLELAVDAPLFDANVGHYRRPIKKP